MCVLPSVWAALWVPRVARHERCAVGGYAVVVRLVKGLRIKDLEAMVEITNEVAGACENCHTVYRRYPEETRCTAP